MNENHQPDPSDLPVSLTRQLIAYIGNKRRLLPFLAPIIAGACSETRGPGGTASGRSQPRFIDPMCGSGAVSRLARHLGYRVLANDWESFAHVATAAYVENRADDLDDLFRSDGGIRRVVDDLNAVGRNAWSRSGDPRGYVASNFAPEFTASPRLGFERLFYTAENARFIDSVRDEIETRFPSDGTLRRERLRRVLVALVVYEASNHANTSGVFKAYHRGFGGHGRDALPRILAPMELEYPAVVDGPRGEAWNEDATEFAHRHSGELCYLDPPYNAHQYGSNYFLLNTICRWDRPPVNNATDSSGRLREKAGIRQDWRRTRSEFCYRHSAARALDALVDSLDCRKILVSYSGSGVVSAEELADLLASHGSLELHGTGYSAYRGGRQSRTRTAGGHELVFEVDRSGSGRARGSGTDRADVARELLGLRVRELLSGPFVPERLKREFTTGPAGLLAGRDVWLESPDFYRLEIASMTGAVIRHLRAANPAELEDLANRLSRARCVDYVEELDVLLRLMGEANDQRTNDRYGRRVLTCLRKYAHRKYRDEFNASVERLRERVVAQPAAFAAVAAGLDRIVEQARSRFGQ